MDIKFRRETAQKLTELLKAAKGSEMVFSPGEAGRIKDAIKPPQKDVFNRKIKLSPDEYTVETGTIPGQTPLKGEVGGMVPSQEAIKKLREDIKKGVRVTRQTPIEVSSFTVESKPITGVEE